MANLNKVFIIGRATRDPEIRYTPKGTAVVDLGLAVNRVYSAEDGEKKEETTFVDVTVFGRQAEIAGDYLRKGSPVFLEGRLQLDTWEQNGQKRSRLRVIGENLQLFRQAFRSWSCIHHTGGKQNRASIHAVVGSSPRHGADTRSGSGRRALLAGFEAAIHQSHSQKKGK